MHLGPVVAHAVSVLGAHDDGDAEVALGVGVPLLLGGRHDDDDEEGELMLLALGEGRWRER